MLLEVNCCREGKAGWEVKELRKLKKKKNQPPNWILGSFCCQGSFHYGNRCCSSLFAVCGNGVYTALARKVEITLGYEELGSNLYLSGPEYRSSESRWSTRSIEVPGQNVGPCTGVSAITWGILIHEFISFSHQLAPT